MVKDKVTVWVIGSKGMLGREMVEILEDKKTCYYATDKDCDITDVEALKSFIRGKNISHIINCAGYTQVDKAEDEPDRAYKLNASGPENIALAAKEGSAAIVHISTDYVFDGRNKGGYTENAEVNPLSVYGKTKAEGEFLVQNCIKEHYIIRTAWLYGKYGNNFVYTMLKLMNEKDSISVIDDQHGSPTYAPDLAGFILFLLETKKPFGIYHFTNMGETTWYSFACEIYKSGREKGLIDSECEIKPISSAEYPSKAERPKYSKLLQANFCNHPYKNSWQKSLHSFLERLKNG